MPKSLQLVLRMYACSWDGQFISNISCGFLVETGVTPFPVTTRVLFFMRGKTWAWQNSASTLSSRIIYCSSLIIPLFQFINNNYRFKSKKHLQCVQTFLFITHARTHARTRDNLRLNNRSLSGHVWIIGNTPPAVLFLEMTAYSSEQ